ncbi:DUF4251 domain-containing protein [Parabacteroides pacaensis]|uniref:DUF4251 domain-containing protein n=1 Tax=Parabacteroides pacaensis TaxID=2086575 RepID=UPI000D0F05F9|nr:DUF4251 domain-containing protein [Parabacteroides pacaensis]
MKDFRFLIVLVLVGVALLYGVQPFYAQSKTDKKNTEEQIVKELLESKEYTIEVDRAIPMRGPSRHLTSPYTLEIKGDSVISYLPYFGEAYSVPYGGGKGLIFEAPITDYKLSFNKKGLAKIKFKTYSGEDTFTYTIEVFPNGSASINVLAMNRQGISFYGELRHDRE